MKKDTTEHKFKLWDRIYDADDTLPVTEGVIVEYSTHGYRVSNDKTVIDKARAGRMLRDDEWDFIHKGDAKKSK